MKNNIHRNERKYTYSIIEIDSFTGEKFVYSKITTLNKAKQIMKYLREEFPENIVFVKSQLNRWYNELKI